MKYLVLFVIFSFSILSFASAYADDEAKSVKHTPYKNMCAPGFVPLDDICVLNDRCGPGVYPGKVCVMDGKPQPYLRPTQQGSAGIAASNVICAEGLNLIFKTSNSSPACVKDSSIDKLEKRGWQTHVPIFACTLEYAPVCGVDGITYGNMCMLESRNIAMDHSGKCTVKKLTEFELDEKFRATQDKITQVSRDIYNGKYNGEMPLNDALSILLDGKTTLTGLNDQYKALDKEMKSDMQIAMRFSTYGRMGYASLDSQINVVKNQIMSSHMSP